MLAYWTGILKQKPRSPVLSNTEDHVCSTTLFAFQCRRSVRDTFQTHVRRIPNPCFFYEQTGSRSTKKQRWDIKSRPFMYGIELYMPNCLRYLLLISYLGPRRELEIFHPPDLELTTTVVHSLVVNSLSQQQPFHTMPTMIATYPNASRT